MILVRLVLGPSKSPIHPRVMRIPLIHYSRISKPPRAFTLPHRHKLRHIRFPSQDIRPGTPNRDPSRPTPVATISQCSNQYLAPRPRHEAVAGPPRSHLPFVYACRILPSASFMPNVCRDSVPSQGEARFQAELDLLSTCRELGYESWWEPASGFELSICSASRRVYCIRGGFAVHRVGIHVAVWPCYSIQNRELG